MIYIINSYMGKPNLVNSISHLDRFLFSLNGLSELSNNSKVIICESSDFDWSKFIKNKNINILYPKIKKFHSRGQAEIEILKSSIPYIENHELICKVTSKFFPIYNKKILNKSNFDIACIITGKPFNPQIDSRFLIMKRNFFINHFLKLKKNINDKKHQSLERVLFKYIITNNIKIIPLNFKLYGMNGFNGKLVNRGFFKSYFWYMLFSFRLFFKI